MFFYLANLVVSLYQYYSNKTLEMRFLRMITKNLESSTVILRRSRISSLFSDVAASHNAPRQELVPPECESQLWSDNRMEVLTVQPQLHVNLKDWTSYLGTQDYADSSLHEGHCHILLEVSPPTDPQKFLDHSLSIPPAKRVKVMDLTNPLAWKAGTPFSIVAKVTPEALAQLGVGLKEGRLLLDDMLQLQCISTVSLHGQAHSLLHTSPPPQTSTPTATSTSYVRERSWHDILDSLHSVLEDEGTVVKGAGPGVVKSIVSDDDDSNESLASLPLPDDCHDSDDEDGSRNFALGIPPQHQQIRKLGGENGFESGSESSSLMGDCMGGEAPSESLEVLAPEVLTPAHRKNKNRSKPPNVLIYCGKKDSSRQYEAVKAVFGQCLHSQRYTVYHLKHDQVHSSPWQENTVLLIIASDKVYDGVDQIFLDYFLQGGTVLSLASLYDAMFVDRHQISKNIGILSMSYKHWRDVMVICGRYVYNSVDTTLPDVTVTTVAKDKQTDKPVILEATQEISGGVALLSQVSFDKDPIELAISPEIFTTLKQNNPARFGILTELLAQLGMDCGPGEAPSLSPVYLVTATQSLHKSLLDSISSRLRDNKLKTRDISLVFCNADNAAAMATVTKETIPVWTDDVPAKKALAMDVHTYLKNINTDVLGNTIFYADVVNTTMNIFEGLMFSTPESTGLIAIANKQVQGQGRGGNTWISPEGCAMFSLHVRIPLTSLLGQRPAFIQHITSLAVVEAVTSTEGYQDLDLRLKWPNDIYFGSTMKLGGVIVKSSVLGNTIHANIGCGFNVNNTDPTVCINDLVRQYNRSHGDDLSTFTVPELIGRTVSQIEALVKEFQSEGREAFVERYYNKWLHSDSPVHIQAEGVDVTIVGLDDHGYLSVRSLDGTLISVHDDGNSFDMMRNLIIPKIR